MVILLLVTALMILWQSFIRFAYFSRKPSNINCINKYRISSPAEGTVVYINRNVLGSEVVLSKMGRTFSKSYKPIGQRERYTHIGIFMSTFDNHHIVNTFNDFPLIDMTGDDNISMIKHLDTILSLFGKTYYRWRRRALDFLSYNQQWILSYSNGVVLIITMDKYVNKIDWFVDSGQVLGLIKRGSQVDMLVPSKLHPTVLINERDHVSFNSYLVSIP